MGRGRGGDAVRWLREHHSDEYVQRSRVDGYRSRASYKLLELQKSDRLMRKGDLVVDLGAAPGGWTQVAAQLVGERGCVVASDILPMDSLADVPAEGLDERKIPSPSRERASITISANHAGDITVCISDPALNPRLLSGHSHRVIYREQNLVDQLRSFWTEVRDANLVA